MNDYTKVSRSLIYKDIFDIEEFGVENEYTIEGEFYNNLLDRPFIKELDDQAEIILKIFNNAHYICTLVRNMDFNRQYLSVYRKIACEKPDDPIWENYITPSTMALVYNLLCYYKSIFILEDRFLMDIKEWYGFRNTKTTQEAKIEFHDQLISKDCSEKLDTIVNKFDLRNVCEAIRDISVPAKDIADDIFYVIYDLSGFLLDEYLKEELDQVLNRLSEVPLTPEIEHAIEEVKEMMTKNGLIESDSNNKTALTTKQKTLFGLALADFLHFHYTNKKEQIGLMVYKLFGGGLASIQRQLCEGYSQNDRNVVADIFNDLSSDFANYIRNYNNRQADHSSQPDSEPITDN